MTHFAPKNTKFAPFLAIFALFCLIFAIFSNTACSKSSVSEPDQMIAFAKRNNINYTKDPSGLMYEIINPGSGTKPRATSRVSAAYEGKFMSDKTFETSPTPIDFSLNGVIQGWTIGLQLIAPGGEIKLIIPSSLGYGPSDYNSIPGGSPLYFDVKLAAIKTY